MAIAPLSPAHGLMHPAKTRSVDVRLQGPTWPLRKPRASVVARAALLLYRQLTLLARRVLPSELALQDEALGLARAQLLAAAARLDIADLLVDGPLSPE